MRDGALEMQPLPCSLKSKDEHRMHEANPPETLLCDWCLTVCREPSKDSQTLPLRANGNDEIHVREKRYRAPLHNRRIRNNRSAGESTSSPLCLEQRRPSETVLLLNPRVPSRAASTRRTRRNRELRRQSLRGFPIESNSSAKALQRTLQGTL